MSGKINWREIIMKRSVLSYLTVLSIFGCDKKEDTSSVENEAPSEPTITASEQETSVQSISPVMDQFLKKSPSTVKVTAGNQISSIFELWFFRLKAFLKQLGVRLLNHRRQTEIFRMISYDKPVQGAQ